MTSPRAPRYVIRRSDGLYYTETETHPVWEPLGLATELTRSQAEGVVASYAESTRRRLRIVEAPR